MKTFTISPKFNSRNLLELHLKNNSIKSYDSFKLCFSLIYSIISLEGAEILKQIGRYYELNLDKRKVSLSIKLLEELQNKEAVTKFSSPLSGKNLPFSSLSDQLDDKKNKKDTE